ncbi:trimeric intracellular cation channel family protein [Luteimicrobium subarcticum]|uniref:Putative membrane protein YeiH n=1 Tax=Luteimicrobium subarcticum TaxID=620910 RepID=A0A2M8W478_9MICO|nr:TRIC cation channel family protein [Luteimicrobium subarcticum]PJI85709.1 putative membrane protein YeiH [Luteimicrobium subarcticum]
MLLPSDLQSALEVAGVFFAALSGALSAVRKRLDLFGVLVLAWVTGLGGGILRDVLIGAVPPVGIADPALVLTVLVAGFATSLFHLRIERLRRAVVVLDAFALGLFVVVGTLKGLQYDVGWLAALFVGTITGIGGGVVRDVLTGSVPLVLQDRQLYAIPALAGSGAVVVLWETGTLNGWTGMGVVAGVVAFRILSLWRGWVVPEAATGGWPSLWQTRRRKP